MSITHTRLQASAASQIIKGTVVVEELEELALRHRNRPKDHTILAANSNFKGRRAQDIQDFDCRSTTTASIPNNNSELINYNRQAGIHGISDGLACGISRLPGVLTVQENHCVINSLVAQEDESRVDNLPTTYSTFSPGLDYLILEVTKNWYFLRLLNLFELQLM